ncbi:MAG: ATP-binding protein [Bacteroidia bacterium]
MTFNSPFKKRFFFTVFFVMMICKGYSQTQIIDSLRKAILENKSTAKQQELVLKMCEQHYSMTADSLLKYLNLAKTIFPRNSIGYFRAEFFYNIYLLKAGKPKDAVALCDSLLAKINDVENSQQEKLELTGGLCNALIRNNQNKEAIEQSFNLLQGAESLRDTLAAVKAYIYLGWANMELGQNTEAIKWLNKGYHYSLNQNFLQQSSSLFSNIASCYNNINRPDSAFFFIELALKYYREIQNLSGTANALNIRADMYLNEKMYAKAEKDLEEALEIRKQIGGNFYIISDMGQLAFFYASTNHPEKGIAIAHEGIALARKNNNLSKLIFLYTGLAENYKVANRLNDYASSLQKIIDLKDSLYDKNSADAIADFEAKYELQKKENIIIRQQYHLAKNRYIIIGIVIFFLLATTLGYMLYKNYHQSEQNKMKIAMEEQRMLSERAVQLAEENERKRIAADLHDNLGSYAAAISSNVKYLKEGVIENSNSITSQLEENAHSMVTQLSDTIWILKNEHLSFTKLADRFKVWILRLMQNYPEVKYHYSENIINDVEFTPTKILHVFLILKECVNNALKHSQCTDLRIQFLSDGIIQVSIEDNGKGIDNNTVSGGNGIENIKYRAIESGWKVAWQQVVPHGTRVVITDDTTN